METIELWEAWYGNQKIISFDKGETWYEQMSPFRKTPFIPFKKVTFLEQESVKEEDSI